MRKFDFILACAVISFTSSEAYALSVDQPRDVISIENASEFGVALEAELYGDPLHGSKLIEIRFRVNQSKLCVLESIDLGVIDDNNNHLATSRLGIDNGEYKFSINQNLLQNSRVSLNCLNSEKSAQRKYYLLIFQNIGSILVDKRAWLETNRLKASAIVKAVKEIHVSDIEAGLPSIKFEDWIRKTFKTGEAVSWQVNDCDEGSFKFDPQKPICVEAVISSAEDYSLHISIIIGETIDQQITKPSLLMVYFYKNKRDKASGVIRVDSISEALSEYNVRNTE
jgi:hypothetical protein